MCKIITVTNQKGGVGKTTTTINLASALKRQGKRVLIIDFDPQGNLSFCVDADNQMSATIYEVLTGEVKMQYAVQRTAMCDIVASNILLSGIELEYTSSGREFLLKQALESVKHYYDVIVIDTPPGLGVLTINAMSASTSVIIPISPDIFSLQGMTQLYETVEQVKAHSNPDLKIDGVLINKFNKRLLVNREVYGAAGLILQELQVPLFSTTISLSTAVVEAQSSQKDLKEYAKKCPVIKEFDRLVAEMEV
ncbi:MAG: ParA family protein [Erysipelotrichaceae bacterium]